MNGTKVYFSDNFLTDDVRKQVTAVLNTLEGLFPERNNHVAKDANGNLYNACIDMEFDGTRRWTVYTFKKHFSDGFLLNADERALMVENKLIPAIKGLRSRYGLGLKESKDHCEFFRDYYRCGPNFLGEFTTPCDHHGCKTTDGNTTLCKRCGVYCDSDKEANKRRGAW